MNKKIHYYRILFFLLLLIFCTAVRADFHNELMALSRIDLLPRFQEGVISKQVSSYDTTGGNDDGFSGKYSFLRMENGTQVIADLEGPGIIHRIWTPTPTNDTIRFFFDGETKPRIELKFIDLFSGKQYPFKRPIVGNEVGGYYCYLPILFKESCKIVFTGKMQFFQIQYSETNSEQVEKSFPEKFSEAEKEALETGINFWKSFGSNILDLMPESGEKLQTFTKDYTIKPGETLPIFEIKKGGRISGIEIIPKVQLNTEFKDLIFRARWDDETVPAINCPLTDFFGYAFGKPSVKSLLTGVSNNKHYCWFPMPFDKKANLELEFLEHQLNTLSEIPISITVYYSENKRSSNEGKFYAEWRREKNPEMGQPYQILKKAGRGHHVGTILQSQGLNSGMTGFFEGDDECYVDGELRIHGTGSEDYFNGGWYALPDRWDQGYSLPLHGCLDYSIPLARTGGFRLHLTDKISFEEDLLLTIEHGPVDNNTPVDYCSVAFYYCDTPPESNELPIMDLFHQIKTPKTLEYWVQLLPVKALSRGAVIFNEIRKDETSEKNYHILALDAPEGGFAKFELEVPSNGEYKIFISYLKGLQCGSFDVNQRQIPIKTNVSAYARKLTFIEKEYMGNLFIEQGTNTITIMLKNLPEDTDRGKFLLHRMYLEKVKI